MRGAKGDKVPGTPVCRSNGDKVGTVARVMIDNVSGTIVGYTVVRAVVH